MKKLYILAAGLFALLAACNKDKSTFADHPLPEVVVSGLQPNYTVYTFRDFLRIDPVVQDESKFDYYWTLFSANFAPDQGLVKPDTLAKTKKLDYEVKQNPGPYILVFNVREKKTGVTKLITTPVNISTLNMSGWYLLKDNAGKTDMDFIYPEGRINNWIAYYNGQSLEGNFMQATFSSAMKASTAATAAQYNALVVLSEKDAGIYRVDNGKMVMNFDNMFYSKPAVRKPQGVFQPINTGILGLINDGKAYNMTKGGLFTTMPPSSYQNLSPITASVAMTLAYDQTKKSIVFIDNGNFPNIPAYFGDTLTNTKANLAWMAGYTGSRSIAMMLFRNPKDTGYLYKVDAHFPQLNGSNKAVYMAKDTLKPEHGLMKASVIGGNYDADYIYYAVGNNVYITDVVTTTERLQLTFPAGEAVTCIQHVKYPQPTASSTFTTDYLAIATYSNGRYKVYLHKISSTGTIQPIATPNFEGEGRVSSVIYMELGNGSRNF